jgi:replicative DNA helicase
MSDSVFSSVEIERKSLRTLLLENNSKSTKNLEMFLSYGFSEKSFTGDFRRLVFNTILNYHKKYGNAPYPDVVWNEMRKKIPYNDRKHLKYIWKMILATSYKSAMRSYLYDELNRYYVLRMMIEVSTRTLGKLNEARDDIESVDPETFVKETIDDLTGIMNRKGNRIREGSIFNDRKFLVEMKKIRENPEKNRGISTGIDVLTQVTNGWNPGEFIVVSGRPGHGKSILLMNFAMEAYNDGKNVLFFTLEMPYRQQQLRAMSRMSGIPYMMMKIPERMSPGEWEFLKSETRRQKKRNNHFLVVDAPENCTVAFVDQKITSMENLYGIDIDMVVIDPIYLMRSGSYQDKRERDDPVGMISGEAKILAMKRGIPILSATQFNREGGKRHQTGREPNTMDLSFSDRLGHNADIILGITSDFNELAQLHILKFRDGMGPRIYLVKKFETMQFVYDSKYNDSSEISKYVNGITEKNGNI